MTAPPIRIGIVGAGANTRAKHLPLLQKIDGVIIQAVCNQHHDSAKRVARDFNIPEVHEHWRDIAEHPDLDAVVIGTWPYLHAPVTLAALAAGKHVLCEARMAMDAKEARRMLHASQARPELVTQVVPSPFTLPWDKTIQRLLADNLLGELLHVDVFANCGAFLDPNRPMTWREDRNLSGLNTMMLGIYYEAMARWTGHARDVVARARTCVPKRRDAEGNLHDIRIPDHLDVFARLDNGAGVHIRCSQVTGAAPLPNDFLLYGELATLRLDLTQNRLSLLRPDQPEEDVHVPENERGRWRVEEEFINAIRGRESVTHTPFEEGLRYMEFTEEVARSAGYGLCHE